MARDIDLDVVRAAEDPTGQPVRVHALDRRVLRSPGEMVMLSLEEWSGSFTIHWFFSTSEPSDEIDLRLQDGLHWELVDDLGNSYRGGDYGGGGGNSPGWRMASHFAPAIDHEATRLVIRVTSPVDAETVEIAVDLGS